MHLLDKSFIGDFEELAIKEPTILKALLPNTQHRVHTQQSLIFSSNQYHTNHYSPIVFYNYINN